MSPWPRRLALTALGGLGGLGLGTAGYVGLITGAVPIDLNVGRRCRTLGPQTFDIDAPRDVVFDVVAQPYLGRPTHAMRQKIRVLERGTDMVLATHFTPVYEHLTARTVETVRFTRPERVDFRLTRGPVPHVVEEFILTEHSFGTRLVYRGELGTDLWTLGEWWGALVAQSWERTVASSLADVQAEAERRAP